MRDKQIDFYRGIAFVNMILFHFIFNLQIFGLIDFDVFTNEYTVVWRGFIIGIFLLCVGISMVVVQIRFKDKKFFSYSLNHLFLASLLVSIVSYIIFPGAWIYFGILHFILFAKFITYFFVNRPFVSLIIAIFISILYFIYGSINVFIPLYYEGGLPHSTMDIIYIVPWLSMVFYGIFLGHFPFYKYLPSGDIKPIIWLGKHSLSMYLLHQAILFPLVFALSFVVKMIG
jgi:uncharacterized membrane protein